MEALGLDIKRFLTPSKEPGYGSGSGDGSGYGDGSGSGYGDGSGSGSGSGYGDGSGYGSGYGDGDGSGDGSGYGSGSGDGSGDGSGYGSGSGDGYGDGSGDGYGDIISFNGHKVHDVDGMPTLIYHVRGDYAKGAILNDDLTLKPCFVARFGDFYGHGDTIHEAFKAAKDKAMEEMPVEERIDLFVREHPDLDKEYGDLFKWHHILTGSCEFGRRQWCEQHGYKPTDSITIRAFLDGTRNDYGRDVIAQVRKRYGLN